MYSIDNYEKICTPSLSMSNQFIPIQYISRLLIMTSIDYENNLYKEHLIELSTFNINDSIELMEKEHIEFLNEIKIVYKEYNDTIKL